MASFVFGTTRQPLVGKRERKTVSTTPVEITPSVYTIDGTDKLGARLASAAVLQVFTNGIIFTIDGSDPEAAVGFEAAAGEFIYLDSAQKVRNFKAIRSGASDAGLEILPLFGA